MQNPFDQFDNAPAPAGLPQVIEGPPREPPPQTATDAALADQQLVNARLEAEAKKLANEEARRKAALPNSGKAYKPLPEAAMTRLEEQVTALSGFERAANGFKDDYSGFGAGLENSLQSYLPVGTSGQRDWWADFKSNDIALRNAMFGASLTPTEKSSWESVTISPGMSADEVKRNIARRTKLAREILSRRAKAYKAGPFDPDQVEAILGEYDPDVAAAMPKAIDGAADDPGPLEVTVTDDRMPGETDEQYLARINGAAGSYVDPKTGKLVVNVIGGKPPEPPAPPPAPPRGFGEQLQDSTTNTVAGLVQGAGGLVDAFVRPLGTALSYPAEALGLDGVAAGLRNSVTIGGAVESVAPTPKDGAGRAMRFISQLGGGVVGTPQSAVNALTNRAASAVSGVELNALGQAPTMLTSRASNALREGQMVQDAADQLSASTGVRIRTMPADVGGAGTRMASAATAKTLGGIQMAKAAEESIGSVKAARDVVANNVGRVLDETGAGQAIRRGSEKFIAETEGRGGALYERISIANEAPAALSNTRGALKALTDPLASNPRLSKLVADPKLKAYLDSLVEKIDSVPTGVLDSSGKMVTREVREGGGLTWQDLKAFRTKIGELAGEHRFGDSTTKVDLQRLYGALSSDMEATARAAGPRALSEFKRANTYWRARTDRIESVLTPLLGKSADRGDQPVFEALNRLAQTKGGDAVKLGRAVRSLPADERADVTATVISRMGQARAGAQDAVGEAFSPSVFVTQWNNLTPRAKGLMFPDRGLRSDLDALARLTSGMKAAQQYANTSNTGLVGNWIALLGGASVNLGATAAFAGMQLGAGKLMSSPAYVRWLTRAARVGQAEGVSGVRREVSRLTALANSNPAFADEIASVQQAMMRALNDNGPRATSAVASDGGQNEDQRR